MEVDCPQFSSVVPITITRRGKWPEVCGSGIMVRVARAEALLTAAHVLDMADEGQLCSPWGDRFGVLYGYIWKNNLLGDKRENDPVDIGYVLFPHRVHTPRTFRHLKLAEVETELPDENGVKGFTLVGYPYRKTKRHRAAINTKQQRYSGSALSTDELRKHGLDPEVHIAFRFSLRKALEGNSDLRKTAPHPRAMSGGGIFAWPTSPDGLKKLPNRFPLVGIFHSYDARRSLMIGTRIEYALAGLQQGIAHLEELKAANSLGKRSRAIDTPARFS